MIRKARVQDALQIKRLVNHYAERGEMLPRSLTEIYENIRDFYVFEKNGVLVGCGALHVTWEDYGEILSLAVEPSHTRQGIGTRILQACLGEASSLGLRNVITLTYAVDFFKKHGFVEVEKQTLPQKLWGMCVKCPKFPECDETPLLKKIP